MFISTERRCCFVCVPKTGTQAMTRFLEAGIPNRRVFNAESLYGYHANLSEVTDIPFSIYDLWSFAVVRNPFDRLVSYCAAFDTDFQRYPIESIRAALLEAVDNPDNRWLKPQVFFTSGVKTIYRFEDLAAAIKDIKLVLNIDDSLQIDVVNESTHGRYSMYFDSELKALVESTYAEDLQEFGYRF